MSKKSYFELLKSPKWQKKRLEILQRDGFKCTNCDEAEETLHVHHVQYLRNKKPWEYANESLKTLCKNCHLEQEVQANYIKEKLIGLCNAGMDNGDIVIILSAILSIYNDDKKAWEYIESKIIDMAVNGVNNVIDMEYEQV